MMDYKQVIHISGNNIDDVFSLPCVLSVMKTDRGVAYNVKCGDKKVLAFVGDYLCERQDGFWDVCTKIE